MISLLLREPTISRGNYYLIAGLAPLRPSAPQSQILDGSPEGLHMALQRAIQLEHSTIPLYLYASYSIIPGTNIEIARIIHAIVVQEMLHMGLVCNILNAIGGYPQIDRPDFIPVYPGPLPGGVEAELRLRLSPLSRELIGDLFMKIEEPEDPSKQHPATEEQMMNCVTIGQFYRTVKEHIEKLTKTGQIRFNENPDRQVTARSPACPLSAVRDLGTALRMIDAIVEQGEGKPNSPGDPINQQSHYHRFKEIVDGKKDDGTALRLEPTGIYPVVSQDQETVRYPKGTPAYNANRTFNYTYTSLLKALDRVFNGQSNQLLAAIGLMESLKEQALAMTSSIRLPNCIMAGPTFEYQLFNR
jgi:Ferritin-like